MVMIVSTTPPTTRKATFSPTSAVQKSEIAGDRAGQNV
jgi:hypothetical protein